MSKKSSGAPSELKRISALRFTAGSASLLLLSLMLVGCTINFGTSGSEDEQGTTGNSTIDSSQAFSGWDIMFAQMMIPHHQQAVEMGALAESRAFSPDVKSLAAKIQAEQSPEITQMTRWLNDTNSPLDMGHDMNMGGMLGEAEMQALQDAKGPAFDKLFLEGMIAHHEGAIEMAQMIVDSNNSEARALGEAIIEAQNEEIRLMQTLLAQS